MAKEYTVNDGTLLLTLEPMTNGGFLVRSPMDPAILATAKTIGEAYKKAYGARRSLQARRRDWAQRHQRPAAR